jgi:hypothetical protein
VRPSIRPRIFTNPSTGPAAKVTDRRVAFGAARILRRNVDIAVHHPIVDRPVEEFHLSEVVLHSNTADLVFCHQLWRMPL